MNPRFDFGNLLLSASLVNLLSYLAVTDRFYETFDRLGIKSATRQRKPLRNLLGSLENFIGNRDSSLHRLSITLVIPDVNRVRIRLRLSTTSNLDKLLVQRAEPEPDRLRLAKLSHL